MALNADLARFDGYLARAQVIADELLAPRACATDQSECVPAEHLHALGNAGLLGLTVPERYGGAEAPPAVVREYLEVLACACGATTFVQLQHLLGCGVLARGANEPLKQAALPSFAAGTRLCTVGYSHLRRPGPPMVRAEIENEVVRFEGTVPWATGWGLADEIVLAGTLPSGEFAYALAPLRENPAISASAPMQLCAMTASATVSLSCRDLILPRERLIMTATAEQMAASDAAGMFMLTALSMGAARGAVRWIGDLARDRPAAGLSGVAGALEEELAELRRRIAAWDGRSRETGYAENAVKLRAWAVELGIRAAHAAVAASGGSANRLDHPAQRLVREAMLYALTAQTRALQGAVLAGAANRAREQVARAREEAEPTAPA